MLAPMRSSCAYIKCQEYGITSSMCLITLIGYMYMYNCVFFSFGHISSCSCLCPQRRVGWAQFDRRAHVAGGLGVIRAVCRAWQAFYSFLALGTLEENPRVSETSLGIVFLHPPSPGMYVKFLCKPGISACRGYTFLFLFLHRAPPYEPAAQQQSSCMRVWLLLL